MLLSHRNLRCLKQNADQPFFFPAYVDKQFFPFIHRQEHVIDVSFLYSLSKFITTLCDLSRSKTICWPHHIVTYSPQTFCTLYVTMWCIRHYVMWPKNCLATFKECFGSFIFTKVVISYMFFNNLYNIILHFSQWPFHYNCSHGIQGFKFPTPWWAKLVRFLLKVLVPIHTIIAPTFFKYMEILVSELVKSYLKLKSFYAWTGMRRICVV